MSTQKVLIFSNENTDPSASPDLMSRRRTKVGVVDIAELNKRLEEMQPALGSVVETLKEKAKPKGLTEITIAIGMNAKGAVGFLGTGAEAGGSATLTLKFEV